jgi:hypothetical protein
MTVKGDFMQFESLCVENGELVRFWEDKWLRETPFSLCTLDYSILLVKSNRN